MAALTTHTANIRIETGSPPYLFGDLNIARASADCSTSIDEGSWPSTYPRKRAALEHLITFQDLVDSYAHLHPALLDPSSTRGSQDRHMSW
jgi:exonuclease III